MVLVGFWFGSGWSGDPGRILLGPPRGVPLFSREMSPTGVPERIPQASTDDGGV